MTLSILLKNGTKTNNMSIFDANLSHKDGITTNKYCFENYDYIYYSNFEWKAFLFIIFLLIALASASCNLLVIYCIYTTRQWKSNSTFLVLVASFCDVMSCITSDIWHSVYIVYVNVLSCRSKIMVFAFNHLWVHGAAYCFCLISIDRFFRVKYLQTYPDTMTPFRFRLMLLVYVCVTVIQSYLLWYGATLHGGYGAANFTKPANLVILLTTISFYLVSIKSLQDIKKQQQHISDETHKLTSMAAIYLTFFTVFFVPTVAFQFSIEQIYSKMSKNDIGIVTFILCFISSIHGLLNAVSFLLINRQSRRLITTKYMELKRFILPPSSATGQSPWNEHFRNQQRGPLSLVVHEVTQPDSFAKIAVEQSSTNSNVGFQRDSKI